MRFKDFNLEPVTVERTSTEYHMTVNKNFVTFSIGIVQALNYPEQVIFAFNKETKVMGIQVCRAKTKGSFKFSKPEAEQKGIVQVLNKNVREALLTVMPEWKPDERYRVEGIHIAEDKAFVFELQKYEKLSPYRKGDGNSAE